MKEFLKLLYISKGAKDKVTNNSLDVQKVKLRKAFNGKNQNNFGLERIVRLILLLQAFIFPAIWIRSMCGKKSKIRKKIVVEIYVFIKLSYIIYLAIGTRIYSHLELYLVIYTMLETLFYLLSIVFLDDVHEKAISFSRSLLLLFINYFEITMSFSIIYKYYWIKDEIVDKISRVTSISSIDSIYFSFVTASTIGYGDIIPINDTIKTIVIIQSVVIFLFGMLFFNKFISALGEKENN
ncbi:MAG: potassium channel family protein [Fusobacteriaceae bacterium]